MNRTDNRRSRCLATAAALFWGVAAMIGCAGYQIGTDGLFNREIKTVYVPMVEADSYRSGLGERLTEAICKKITEKTPYDLALSPSTADSILNVHLVAENQSVSALNAYNNTRQKNLNWSIRAVWRDRRDQTIAEMDPVPLTSIGITVSEQAYLVAETGQSTAVTQQDLIDQMADRVVGLMEIKW